MIYTSARWADEAETQVTGTDADGNTETRSINYPHEWRRANEFITGFLAAGGVIEPFQSTATNITTAPSDLFGGPTLKEIYRGN